MKMGRFDESIKTYQKALSLDPNFVASHVGIGNDYLAMGRPAEARTAFAKIAAVARTTGERRLARFWTAASYVHEERDREGDRGAAGGIRARRSRPRRRIHVRRSQPDGGRARAKPGRLDDAPAKYAKAVTVSDTSTAAGGSERGDAAEPCVRGGPRSPSPGTTSPAAKTKAAEYARQVAVKKVPFEVRQQHELAGLIALEEKRASAAAQEFAQANQQDPKILYLTAIAWRDAGNAQRAATFAAKAANFNGLSFNYGYVRSKAQKITRHLLAATPCAERTIGSTFVARRAGRYAASIATAANAIDTATNVVGSSGVRPNSIPCR